MKRLLKNLLIFVAALGMILAGLVVLTIGSYAAHQFFFYDRQFNALRTEIEKHDHVIIDQWRHEDMTLEDFGFTVRTNEGEFKVNILDGTKVRVPRDKIEGLAVYYPNQKGLRAFRFDSDYWMNLNLPKISIVADVIQHSPAILSALRQNPPAISHPSGGGNNANHARHLSLALPPPPLRTLPR